jgi:hypothetical protein
LVRDTFLLVAQVGSLNACLAARSQGGGETGQEFQTVEHPLLFLITALDKGGEALAHYLWVKDKSEPEQEIASVRASS